MPLYLAEGIYAKEHSLLIPIILVQCWLIMNYCHEEKKAGYRLFLLLHIEFGNKGQYFIPSAFFKCAGYKVLW
jgi:hypothetical protein